ncbi:hypothetical protein GCM10008096_06010 [Zhihengliuella salsuginis]|uniref:Sulfate exporter family transporter n=2 Tax=Zhihengliuella salsuginis TaxID=578222 RepID=A0ABQ3GCI1_9MICC|nr:hypothetical protein GCM10008096_06010 [Zhihengliuella salsuginis]
MRPLLPGLLAAAVVVGCGFGLHAALGALPVMTLCVLGGAVAGHLLRSPARRAHALRRLDARIAPGLAAAGRTLMRAGIVLLGLQLVPADLAALRLQGVGIVLAAVALAFAGTWLTARLFRLPGDEPVLLAAGFSICGASAIGAMGQARGTARDASTPIALVTLCGTLSIALLPFANEGLGLAPMTFGHWVGASVHDVGQVVATAQTAGTTALAAAVVVKLVRVLALAPVATLGAWHARRARGPAAGGARAPILPLFVVGFGLMVALRTTGWLPDAALEAGRIGQELLLGAALAGLGYAIDLRTLFASAGRSTGAAVVAWAWVAAVGLAVAHLLSNGSFMI